MKWAELLKALVMFIQFLFQKRQDGKERAMYAGRLKDQEDRRERLLRRFKRRIAGGMYQDSAKADGPTDSSKG